MSETSPQAGANDNNGGTPGEPGGARSATRFVGGEDEPPPGISFGHAWNERAFVNDGSE